MSLRPLNQVYPNGIPSNISRALGADGLKILGANAPAPVPAPAPKTTTNPVKPTAPLPKQTSAPKLNALNLTANAARDGDPIPSQYGRFFSYPDLISNVITTIAGETALQYYLFCIGHGSHEIEQISIGGSNVDSIGGVSYEVLQPGQNVTLFPTLLRTNPDIKEVKLTTNYSLHVEATSAQAKVTTLAFDLSLSGLYKANNDGTLASVSVSVVIQARTVTNSGTGAWATLGTELISAAQSAPIKKRFEYTVSLSRYEVRLKRTTAESTDPRTIDKVVWNRVTGLHTDHPDYGNVTLLAVKAVSQLKPFELKDTRVKVVSTRKLRTWNGAAWTAELATRSIIWAIADTIMSSYGSELPDTYLDLSGLKTLDDLLTLRGDAFDGRINTPLSVMEAANMIAAAGRCQVFQQFGQFHVARDQQQAAKALFTPSNMESGSFYQEYTPAGYAAPDHIVMEYTDQVDGTTQQVTCDFGTTNIEEHQRIEGVNNTPQSYREGMYLLASDLYRRVRLGFTTGLEGYIPKLLDHVLVGHDRNHYGQWGEVFNTELPNKIITSNPIVPGALFTLGNESGDQLLTENGFDIVVEGAFSGILYISTEDGGITAALEAISGGNNYEMILPAGLPEDALRLAINDDAELSRYLFVDDTSSARRMIITSIEPQNADTIAIHGIADDDRVHTSSEGIMMTEGGDNVVTEDGDNTLAFDGFSPAPSSKKTWDVPTEQSAQTDSSSNSNLSFGSLRVETIAGWTPQWNVSWQATGYDSFLIEITQDGSNWSKQATTAENSKELLFSSLIGAPQNLRVTPYKSGIPDSAKTLYKTAATTNSTTTIANTTNLIFK